MVTLGMIEREALFQNLARDIAERLNVQRPSLVLAGGTSPRDFYPHLAASGVQWREVTATLSDERWVPASDPDSNERMVRERLFAHLPALPEFVPLKTPHPDPEGALDLLDARIRDMPRPFDACLLGMGLDGHVAGLVPGFEGTEAALDLGTPRKVAALRSDKAWRVSLTLPALLDSRWIAILCLGAEKAEIYRRAVAGELPATPIGRLSRLREVAFYWAP